MLNFQILIFLYILVSQILNNFVYLAGPMFNFQILIFLYILVSQILNLKLLIQLLKMVPTTWKCKGFAPGWEHVKGYWNPQRKI